MIEQLEDTTDHVDIWCWWKWKCDMDSQQLKSDGYTVVPIKRTVGPNVTSFISKCILDKSDVLGFKGWHQDAAGPPHGVLVMFYFIAMKDQQLIKELLELATIDAIAS